jgi:predicted AlkP superfamily phosphohydrolase/phosphomutase
VRDPATGEQVVRRVYRSEDIYSGPARLEAPDLIIGYNRGYRIAWESVLGFASSPQLADNADKWSGDHAMAGELVPGVLLASKPVKPGDPDLVDLAPTILSEFDVPKLDAMTGRALF